MIFCNVRLFSFTNKVWSYDIFWSFFLVTIMFGVKTETKRRRELYPCKWYFRNIFWVTVADILFPKKILVCAVFTQCFHVFLGMTDADLIGGELFLCFSHILVNFLVGRRMILCCFFAFKKQNNMSFVKHVLSSDRVYIGHPNHYVSKTTWSIPLHGKPFVLLLL